MVRIDWRLALLSLITVPVGQGRIKGYAARLAEAGMSVRDIAKKLNVRPAYVSLAKNRCLPRLRAILMKIKRTEDGAF